jgi:hypothetical protein
MRLKEISVYRDGGTTAFEVILNVLEQEKLKPYSMPVIISVDGGMNGDGQWYLGLKSKGGTIIEDIEIKQALIKAFNEKVQYETLILENIKQFL